MEEIKVAPSKVRSPRSRGQVSASAGTLSDRPTQTLQAQLQPNLLGSIDCDVSTPGIYAPPGASRMVGNTGPFLAEKSLRGSPSGLTDDGNGAGSDLARPMAGLHNDVGSERSINRGLSDDLIGASEAIPKKCGVRRPWKRGSNDSLLPAETRPDILQGREPVTASNSAAEAEPDLRMWYHRRSRHSEQPFDYVTQPALSAPHSGHRAQAGSTSASDCRKHPKNRNPFPGPTMPSHAPISATRRPPPW
jgi:hypothetical protein